MSRLKGLFVQFFHKLYYHLCLLDLIENCLRQRLALLEDELMLR